MATYTYRCEDGSDRVFEVTQSVHDDPLTEYEVDGKVVPVKRIIVPGTSFRIGGAGVHKPTSMFNVSNDPGRR